MARSASTGRGQSAGHSAGQSTGQIIGQKSPGLRRGVLAEAGVRAAAQTTSRCSQVKSLAGQSTGQSTGHSTGQSAPRLWSKAREEGELRISARRRHICCHGQGHGDRRSRGGHDRVTVPHDRVRVTVSSVPVSVHGGGGRGVAGAQEELTRRCMRVQGDGRADTAAGAGGRRHRAWRAFILLRRSAPHRSPGRSREEPPAGHAPEQSRKTHRLERLIKSACTRLLSVSQALELEIHASNEFAFFKQHQTAVSSFWVLNQWCPVLRDTSFFGRLCVVKPF